VYDALAAALVAESPVPLEGARALDLGAGSGAASKAVAAAGGRPVALDAALDMLRHARGRRPPAVVGDARRLPLAAGSFDAAVAAFVLSHVPDPAAVLAEARRVVRPGGAVLASAFGPGPVHPCKARIDAVAARWGWREPAWYRRLKEELEPQVGEAGSLARLAAAAGLEGVRVVARQVDTGVSSPAALVGWRLGMAQVAPFVAGLPPGRRAALEAEALAAVGPDPQPLRPTVLMLSSRVPAHRVRVPA
jgi:SAM-dependent methyltransferase